MYMFRRSAYGTWPEADAVKYIADICFQYIDGAYRWFRVHYFQHEAVE